MFSPLLLKHIRLNRSGLLPSGAFDPQVGKPIKSINFSWFLFGGGRELRDNPPSCDQGATSSSSLGGYCPQLMAMMAICFRDTRIYLKLTDIFAPENRMDLVPQKGKTNIFQPSIFWGAKMLVSGRVSM